jgi:DNA-binding PadR family transcriptional regulator
MTASEPQVTVTLITARVLAALLEDPTGEHYGLELMHRAGVSSGTLYPILRRLANAGWVTDKWEVVDPSEAARPRRRYYSLTRRGTEGARLALAEISQLGRRRRGRRAGKTAAVTA